MGDVIKFNPARMSSAEIADLTGKSHEEVQQDIYKVLETLHGEKNIPKFVGFFYDENNLELPCYYLQKKELFELAGEYPAMLRMKIITRFEELEVLEGAIDDPNFLRESLKLYLGQLMDLEEECKELRVKAEAYDRLMKGVLS